MDSNPDRMTKAGLVASAIAATGASLCCIGPLAAAFLGLTSMGALVRLEPYRPLLLGTAVLLLGVAFYLAYRKPKAACEPGSLCSTHGESRLRTINRTVLWVVTAIVVAIATFPTWSSAVLQ